MNSDPMDLEAQRQAAADRLDRVAGDAGADAAVERYRLLSRAVRCAPMPELPTGFAAQVARAVRDFEEQAEVEVWLVRGAIALGLVGAAVMLQPFLPPLFALIDAHVPGLPWRLLLAAGLGLLSAGLMDTVNTRRRADQAGEA